MLSWDDLDEQELDLLRSISDFDDVLSGGPSCHKGAGPWKASELIRSSRDETRIPDELVFEDRSGFDEIEEEDALISPTETPCPTVKEHMEAESDKPVDPIREMVEYFDNLRNRIYGV